MKKVSLGRREGKPLSALLDDGDFYNLRREGWRFSPWSTGKNWYCMICRDGEQQLLHRYLTKATPLKVVDHLNHNTLDNRRSNLKVCTHAENSRNLVKGLHADSQYIGVSRAKGRYRSRLSYQKRQLHLGCFETEEAAARAHSLAIRVLLQQDDYVNFPGIDRAVMSLKSWLKITGEERYIDYEGPNLYIPVRYVPKPPNEGNSSGGENV